jgi:hypothetical protein
VIEKRVGGQPIDRGREDEGEPTLSPGKNPSQLLERNIALASGLVNNLTASLEWR